MALFTKFDWDFTTRRNHLLLLLHLVGYSSADEEYKSYISNVLSDTVGLARKETKKLIALTKTNLFSLPKSESKRLTCFYHLLFMLRLNGELLRDEKELCKSVGFKLGLNPLLVIQFLNIAERHTGPTIPTNKFMEAIKSSLN